MEKNLIPNFLMSVDDINENVYETSFVSDPATDMKFLLFSKDDVEKELEFKVVKDQERVTSGVWMMPDTKYLRKTDEGDLYTVEFSKDTLKKALLKHLKSDFANAVKLEHSGNYLDGFVAVEHWVIENEFTKSPVYGNSLEDLGYSPNEIPVGTVMKSTYVADQIFWNEKIVTGEVKGYSIGGLFNLQKFEKQVTEFSNPTSKVADLFLFMGVLQDSGSIVLEDKSVLDFNKDIKHNDTLILDGEFKALNGLSLIIKDGSLVDFGFDNEVVTEDVVVTEPIIEDVVEDVIESEPIVEDSVIEDVVVTEPIVDVIESEPITEDIISEMQANYKELKDSLSLLQTELSQKDEEIAKLKNKLGEQPIVKTNTNIKSKETVAPKVGKTIQVGNRTVVI